MASMYLSFTLAGWQRLELLAGTDSATTLAGLAFANVISQEKAGSFRYPPFPSGG
jgi:hypothetical protein